MTSAAQRSNSALKTPCAAEKRKQHRCSAIYKIQRGRAPKRIHPVQKSAKGTGRTRRKRFRALSSLAVHWETNLGSRISDSCSNLFTKDSEQLHLRDQSDLLFVGIRRLMRSRQPHHNYLMRTMRSHQILLVKQDSQLRALENAVKPVSHPSDVTHLVSLIH